MNLKSIGVGALLALLVVSCGRPPQFPTVWDRPATGKFTSRIVIPTEAVIYMQNLTLLRSRVSLGAVNDLELLLPPRVIVESLQLRLGDKRLREFNIATKYTRKMGQHTRVLVRGLGKYQPQGKNLVIEYLSWGIHWSAEYRVDVLPGNKLNIRLAAVIQNDFYDLASTKATLVAGWVGVSGPRRHSALPAWLDGAVASLRPPTFSSPRRQRPVRATRRRLAGGFALSPATVSKYRIRRVDKTMRSAESAFQQRFSRYYFAGDDIQPSVRRSLYNKVDGYSLYRDLRVTLRRGQKSYLRMTSAEVKCRPHYLWPADQGSQVYTVYKVPNRTDFLLPAGTAWIHRDGVFVGQDIHHWTPTGGHAYLTTSNDGAVAVKKQKTRLADDTERTRLTVRSLAKHAVVVEILATNPLATRKGHLTLSEPPQTAGQKGPYHRWRFELAAGKRHTLQIDFKPAPPPKVPKPGAGPRPSPTPR